MLYALFYNTFPQVSVTFNQLLTEMVSGPQFTTVELGSLLPSLPDTTQATIRYTRSKEEGPALAEVGENSLGAVTPASVRYIPSASVHG